MSIMAPRRPAFPSAWEQQLEDQLNDALIDLSAAQQKIAELEAERDAKWRPIETLSEAEDDKLILACVESDGRMMPWRASMLKRQLREGSPRHLTFPATHWRDMPLLPNGQPAPLLPPISGGSHG